VNNIKNVIFDLGGVLIDWNPEYVYLDVFNGDRQKMKWFFDEICPSDWNLNQDAGYPLAEATKERIALFPEHKGLIEMFYGRWEEMLGEAIEGTVAVLNKLREDYKVVALTNWSHETFPVALERFEFLHWFEGIVVSGEEKTRKPFDDIYLTTLERFNIKPEESIFIDDNADNIETANRLGINGIHFKTPELLKEQLQDFNITL